MLQRAAVCVAVFGSALQFVAVRCNMTVVAAAAAGRTSLCYSEKVNVWQCVAKCCSVLQCVLQCFAVLCSALQRDCGSSSCSW